MPIVSSDGLAGTYDYRLVALSVLISALASYAALDLGGRGTASRGSVRSIWLMGGAAAMGLGIWHRVWDTVASNCALITTYDRRSVRIGVGIFTRALVPRQPLGPIWHRVAIPVAQPSQPPIIIA